MKCNYIYRQIKGIYLYNHIKPYQQDFIFFSFIYEGLLEFLDVFKPVVTLQLFPSKLLKDSTDSKMMKSDLEVQFCKMLMLYPTEDDMGEEMLNANDKSKTLLTL